MQSNYKYVQKKDKLILKKGRKTVGFIGKNSCGFFYAFGLPSAPSYIAFQCKDKEKAKFLLMMNH